MLVADLGKYMDKSTSNSEGSSAGSHTNGGIVGSTSAPQAYGIQFMPQPQSASALMPDLSQGALLLDLDIVLPEVAELLCVLLQALPAVLVELGC